MTIPYENEAQTLAALKSRLADIDSGLAADQQQKTLGEMRQRLDKINMDLGIMSDKEKHGIRSTGEAAGQVKEGVLNSLLLPFDIIGADRAILGNDVADRLGVPSETFADKLRTGAENRGWINPKDDKPVGLAADALEFFGGSIPFGMGMFARGAWLNKNVAESAMSWVDRSMAEVAGKQSTFTIPGKIGKFDVPGAGKSMTLPTGYLRSTSLDASSSLGAGIGGEIAGEDSPNKIYAQLVGGIVHPMSVLNKTLSAGGKGYRTLRDMVPVGEAVNYRRAAKAIQKGYANPSLEANRIDVNSNVPASRQLGSEKGLQLEQKVLQTDPNVRQYYSDTLNKEIDDAITEARALGDARIAGAELKSQSKEARDLADRAAKHNIKLMEIRSTQAAEEANIAVQALGPDAKPSDISDAIKVKVEKGLKASRTIENNAWKAVDQKAVVDDLGSTFTTVEELSARISPRYGDSSLIPDNVRRLLKDYQKYSITGKNPITMRDIQSIRTEIGSAYDVARKSGDKARANALNEINRALMKDMKNVKASGIDSAIETSRILNEKYTQGFVGDLLSVKKGGVARVPGREAMPTLTGRRDAAEGLQQMIKGDPSIADDVTQYVQSSYYTTVINRSGGDPGKLQTYHADFMRNLKKHGVMDAMPEVEAQLVNTRNSVLKDSTTRARLRTMYEKGAERRRYNINKAVANDKMGGNGELYLDKLLKSDTPIVDAKKLVNMMDKSPDAKEGLKAAFVNTLYRKATTASGEIDFKVFNDSLKGNREVALALGFTPADMARIDKIHKVINQSNMKPAGSASGSLTNDAPGFFMNALARYVGARAAKAVPTSGSAQSLQMTQIFAGGGSKFLKNLTKDRGAELIIASHTDNQLYQALMTAPTSSPAQKRAAAKYLNAWILGVAAKDNYDKEQN